MIRNLVQLNYRDHHVHISLDKEEKNIILFKYNDRRCDWAVYKRSEYDQAAEFVLEPLPEGEWAFVQDDEQDT